MNMFKAVKAKTINEYLETLPIDRRNSIEALDKLIRKTAPSLKPYFAYNMPGYGSFKYTNYKNDVIDWPIIALANQKNYISIYICSVVDGNYVAEKYSKELGRVNVGKSCIRFKKFEDLNLKILEKVILLAAKSPGLSGIGANNKN